VFSPQDNAIAVGLGLSWIRAICPDNEFLDLIGCDMYDHTGQYPPANSTTWASAWTNTLLPRLTAMNTFAIERGKRQMFGEIGSFATAINGGDDNGGGDNPTFWPNIKNWLTSHADSTTGFEYMVHFNNPGKHDLEASYFANARASFISSIATLPHPWT
jgi:hypothetical protein